MATTTSLGQLQYGDLTLLPGNDTTSSGFGNLAVAGTAYIAGASTTIAGTLSAAGATTLGSTLDVTDATTLSGTLSVTGISTFDNTVTITPTTTVGLDVNPTDNTGGVLNVNGDVVLGGAAPRIYMAGASLGLPTFTSRTAGAKVVLYPGIAANSVDYSIGIDTNVFWSAVPTNTGAQSFRWYGGTTELMRLDGTGKLTANSMSFIGTDDSSSTTTGALVIPGGVGIGKSLWVGSVFNVAGIATLQNTVILTSTADASSATTGALQVAGGITVGASAKIGNSVHLGRTAPYESGAWISWNRSTGYGETNFMNQIGLGSQGGFNWINFNNSNVVVNTPMTLNGAGILSISTATDSSSTTTGALQVAGGVGIAKSVYIGGILNIGVAANQWIAFGTAGTIGIASNNGAFFASAITNDLCIRNPNQNIRIGTSTGTSNLDIAAAGYVKINTTIESTSTTTGSLVVLGGVGIGKSLWVGTASYVQAGSWTSTGNDIYLNAATNTIYLRNVVGTVAGQFASSMTDFDFYTTTTTTYSMINFHKPDGIIHINTTSDSTGTGTGALQIAGGVYVAKNTYIDGNLSVTGDISSSADTITFTGGTGSTSPTTGTVVITGGLGVSENIYAGGIIVSTNTTESTSTGSGALVIAGGAGIGSNLFVGGVGSFVNTTDSSSTTTGAVVVGGGVGIGATLNVGGDANVNQDLSVTNNVTMGGIFTNDNTTNSTSPTSGAFVVSGGVGIGLNLNVGGNQTIGGTLAVNSTVDSTTTADGSLVVAGGLGVAKHGRFGSGVWTNMTAFTGATSPGQFLNVGNALFTDNSSAAAGTVATWSSARVQAGTVAATNTGVTYTTASSLSISGAPTAGTNVTITNAYALRVASGVSYFGDATDSSSTGTGAVVVAGGVGIAASTYVGGNLTVKATSWISTGNDVFINAATSSLYLRNTVNTVAGQFESTLDDFNFRSTTATSYNILNIHKPDGIVYINTTTQSTSGTTGALVVAGGIGASGNANIGGDLYVGGSIASGAGIINFSDTTDSTAPDNGAVKMAGGMGIGKHLQVGYGIGTYQSSFSYTSEMGQFLKVGTAAGTTYTDSGTAADGTVANWSGTQLYAPTVAATNTGITYTAASSFYIAGAPVAGTNVTMTDAYAMYVASGRIYSDDTTQSTSVTTGALVVTGGAGIGGNLNVGGNIGLTGSQTIGGDLSVGGNITGIAGTVAFSNTTDSSSSTTGSVTIAGGVGIAKNLYVGSTLTVSDGGNFGGNINMTGTNPLFTFSNSAGLGLPTFTTRSTGTRILLFSALSAASADWAVGISSDTLWNSVPTAIDTNYFGWYGGTTQVMRLSGAGNLTLLGKQIIQSTTASTSGTTGALQVAGGVGISGNMFIGGTATGGGITQYSTGGATHVLQDTSGTPAVLRTITVAGANYIQSGTALTTGSAAPLSFTSMYGANVWMTLGTTGTLTINSTADATGTASGALQVAGGIIANNIWVSNAVRIPDTKFVNFGYGVAGKETNAGKIGYQVATVGSLDIFGAGTAVGSRSVKLWDNVTINNGLIIGGTTPSTSPTTGALTIVGGLGVGGDEFIGGLLNVAGTGTITGAFIASSTATIAGVLTVTNNTNSTAPTNGSIQTAGGLGVVLNTNLGGTLTVTGAGVFSSTVTIAGITNVTNTTDSTTPANGAFIVGGGVGIGLNCNIGGSLSVNGNTTIAGNLTVLGTRSSLDVQTLTISDNVILVNSAPGGTADSGYAMKRWQYANDTGLGDVVNNDTPDFTGTATGGTATTITLPATASAVDGYYNGAWIRITSGTGVGQVRRIRTYDGTTKIATIYTTADQGTITPTPNPVTGMDFTTVPTATSGYQIFMGQFMLTYYDEQYHEYTMGYTPIDPTGDSSQPVTGAVDVFKRVRVHAGSLILDRYLNVDTINENTTGAGVTVAGVGIKSGAMTGVTSINGTNVDYYGQVTLDSTDKNSTATIPGTQTAGTYIVMVQDQISSGSSATFMISGSSTRGGSVFRAVSTLGARMEHLTMTWAQGGLPTLTWLGNPNSGTGLVTYNVKVIRL